MAPPKTNVDPLDDIVMRTEEVEGENRRILADLLRPHVRMDPETAMIHFVPYPPNLNTKQQVLVYLLAKQALAQKNQALEPIASSKDIQEGTGLPGSSLPGLY